MSQHEHLLQNRQLILERVAYAGAFGLLPVPVLDELLSGAVRATLLRRIATIRQVDAEESALSHLAASTVGDALEGTSRRRAALRVLRRSFRKLASVLQVANRADEVASTFAVATLFDHYCTLHHVGPGVDDERARLLRLAIEGAVSDARGALTRRGVGRVAQKTTEALSAVPRSVLRRVGLEARLLPAEVVPPAETLPAAAPSPAPGTALAGEQEKIGLVRSSANAIATLFGDVGRSWVEELVRAFDRRWAELSAAPPPATGVTVTIADEGAKK